MTFLDLTGKTFGRLTAVARVGSRPGGGAIWQFTCECGNTVDCDGANVRRGLTKSCGCLKTEGPAPRHGMSRTTTHNTWVGMRQRCENPDATAYVDYGGRGIRVCARWQIFENFLADMGTAPAGMTIERRDNSKGYEPGNCIWATQKEQVRNRRTSLRIEHNGQELSLTEWCEHFGLPYQTVWCRYKEGKRGHALFAPLRGKS